MNCSSLCLTQVPLFYIANLTSQNQKSSSKEYKIGGLTYNVTVTYHTATGTHDASAVLIK